MSTNVTCRLLLPISILLIKFVNKILLVMNKRLEQFLSAENISQSQFAENIGVARASISHILSGRNKPGYDFLEKMAINYPQLNLEWLITGKGRMYKTSAQILDSREDVPAAGKDVRMAGKLIEKQQTPEVNEPELFFQEENAPKPDTQPMPSEAKDIASEPVKSRAIKKVVIFYDDGTYKEIL